MNQDVDNTLGENSIVFDDRMLSKLRRIVPRRLSDFQVFAKNLTGDNISDVVIQEVWEQIYHENASTAERDSESQELVITKSLSDGIVVDPILEVSTFSNGKVPKQRCESQPDETILKKLEMPSCKSGFKRSDIDPSFTDIATKHPNSNESTTLCSVVSISKSEMNREISHSVKTLQEKHQTCLVKSIETNVLLERGQMEEKSSSDCEIIEIVPSDRVGADNCNLGSEVVADNDGNKSDSDESVKILHSSNSGVQKTMKRYCLIHGCNDNGKVQHCIEWNYCTKQKSMYIEEGSVENNENVRCDESLKKGKQPKNKKGKKGKYNCLKSEVKHLRSVLYNLMLSHDVPQLSKLNGSEERTDCRNCDYSGFVSDNGQKKRKGKESFGQNQCRKKTCSKSRSRIALTETLQTSAFMEMNVCRKTAKSPKTKQTNKRTKNSSKQPPVVVDLDSDSSDLGNKKRKRFLWRENIVYFLRSTPGRWMSVKKLKRVVIARYYYFRGNVSQNTTVKFFRYLHATKGVIVDGDMAIYCKEPIIKVSPESDKKEFVIKTHTTTKEHKLS